VIPELSVVLPVYNQADHIVGVVARYRAVFKKRPWEMILVPNACIDDSPRLCRQMARKNKNIRVVENPKGGWGLSVRMGLQAARGRFLCYTNSARTDPAVIPPLFEKAQSQPGILTKIKRVTRGRFLRDTGSLLYNLECRLLFHIKSGDVNGTPKIFQAGLLKKMKLTSDGDLLDAELLAQCQKLGVQVLETPLSGWNRHGGKSTTKLKSAAGMYWGVIRLWREMK
jgi:glycosyltransferase involved in cell wall biosynthesis